MIEFKLEQHAPYQGLNHKTCPEEKPRIFTTINRGEYSKFMLMLLA